MYYFYNQKNIRNIFNNFLAHIATIQTLLSYWDIKVRFSIVIKKKKRSKNNFPFESPKENRKKTGDLGLHLQPSAEAAAAKVLLVQKCSGQRECIWENNWIQYNWVGAILGLGHKAACQKEKPVFLHLGCNPTKLSPPCVKTPVIFNHTGGRREASMFSLKYHHV